MQKSVVQTNTFQQWFLVGFFAITFLALVAFCYWIVEKNSRDFNDFSNAHLPTYEAFFALESELSKIESQLHFLSSSSDSDVSVSELANTVRSFGSTVESIKQSIPAESTVHVSALRSIYEALLNLVSGSQANVTVSDASPSNSEAGLAGNGLLRQSMPLLEQGRVELESLIRQMNEKSRTEAKTSLGRLSQAAFLVMLLATANFFGLIMLVRMNYARRLALREQSRLASHVRNNPNPVFALSKVGEIIYQNTAAIEACARWSLDSPLPDNLENILLDVDRSLTYEYYKGGRYFEINLAYLEGFSEYHAFLTDVTESKKAEEDLEYLAYHDPVTGLVNRQQFCEFVDEALSQEDDRKLTVAMMDLDLFDKVVVAAGMSVADKVARVAAIRFQRVVTKEQYFNSNSLSYIGGGMFCFAYPSDPIDANILIKRMREEAAQPFDIEGFEFYLGLSVGMVSGKHLKDGSSEDALRLADAALSLAKKRGGDRIIQYESWIAERHNRRVEIEFGLRAAIQQDQFELFYQPKISLQTGRICGAEALLRWETREGYISPAEFIPIAEETGQIMEVGHWVINQACKDVATWNRQGHTVPVAINVSAVQLLHSDVASLIKEAAQRMDIPVSWIEAEVTETAVIEDFARAMEKLQELQEMGVAVALDDFGTGYSSLSYLQRLPVDILKIDRGFVQQLRIAALKDSSLVEGMIGMAHQLNLKVVAEGVEVQEQLDQLYDWGCEYAQGYLIAKPMTLTDFLIFNKEFEPIRAAQ